jgi:hypothetical protein
MVWLNLDLDPEDFIAARAKAEAASVQGHSRLARMDRTLADIDSQKRQSLVAAWKAVRTDPVAAFRLAIAGIAGTPQQRAQQGRVIEARNELLFHMNMKQ